MRKRLETPIRDSNGAAAVEFSLPVIPFFIIIFGILDMALVFFIDGPIDSALRMAARNIRTGGAAGDKWDLARFKARFVTVWRSSSTAKAAFSSVRQ